MVRNWMMGIAWAGLFGIACASSMGDMKSGMKSEACATGCDEAKSTCVEKCSEEVDKDACKLACDAARDECTKECKS